MNYDTTFDKLLFRVEDTGVGVNDNDYKKLFALFGKLDTTRNVNTSGIGLGLNICKKLVNAMGG